MTKHFVLSEVSFIGGALLAVGSRVTSDDLGTYIDAKDGKEKEVSPGRTLIEIDGDTGQPVNKGDYAALQGIAGSLSVEPIAAVAPFAPHPTRAQGAPAQPPGGVSLAERGLRTGPAEGVESNEAAAARLEQAVNAAKTTEALGGGSTRRPAPDPVTRRSGARGGAKKPARAAPKPKGAATVEKAAGDGVGENNAT